MVNSCCKFLASDNTMVIPQIAIIIVTNSDDRNANRIVPRASDHLSVVL
jgi:hypothetical protein